MKSKDIPTPQILRELGFDVLITCRWCGLKIDTETRCCGDTNFDVRFRETGDRDWITEDDAISRVEQNGKAEKYFNKGTKQHDVNNF
jgi:hypothetical protein